MTTILVTGSTGMVGSRLLPRLAQRFDVRALLRGGAQPPEGATGVHGDLNDPASLESAVADVDAIVHLAAVFRTDDEDAIWRANRDGTRNLLDAARIHAPEARVIMTSTSNVYDVAAARPGREDDTPAAGAAYPA